MSVFWTDNPNYRKNERILTSIAILDYYDSGTDKWN